jgi:eukaryotic-like serine/threonine-protein kinase
VRAPNRAALAVGFALNVNARSFSTNPLLQLGRHRLIIELAQGGMGHVYLAVAQGPAGFTKLSVIKELKPTLMEEEGFLDMFLDEARLSARLSHPNVVQTNEVNVENGRAFFAMEYLDGQALLRVRSRLGRAGTLALGPHVRVLAEACNGLHYAHELRDLDGVPLNVVHRDVSPHNIFVTYDGQVKLVDFGVAKAMSQSHETTVGVVKGKVPYMAPEHARSEAIDRRADIFSIGVLLWEAVAGKRMWTGHSTEGVLRRLATNDIPSITEAGVDVDSRLANIVARATAAFPEARYPTADLLRRDLDAWLATRTDGGHQALRDLGEEMTRGFAKERAEVSAAIHQQLQLLREAAIEGRSWNVGLVRLNDPVASGSHPHLSQSQPMLTLSGENAVLPRLTDPVPGSGSAPAGSGASAPGAHASASMVMATAPSVGRPPRSRAPIYAAMIAGTLLVAFAGGLLISKQRADSHAAESPVATATTVAEASAPANVPSVAPAASVRVQLRALPQTARIFLDGAPLASNPHVASVRMDAASHQVRVEALGYVSKTEVVSFDRDVDLAVTLDRIGVVAPRTRPGAPSPAEGSAERPEPTPSKPTKRQRPIDTDLEPR